MILTIFDDFLKGREGDRSQGMNIYTFLVDLGVLSPFSQESRLVSRPSGSQIQNYGEKKGVQKSHFLLLKKRVSLALKYVAPPPPHSMLKSCVRSRRLASPSCFPTLIGGAGGPPKVAILETGRNTTFGALLKTFGARNSSGFVARLPIWWPWAPSAHRMLQEACKSGIPDLVWLLVFLFEEL